MSSNKKILFVSPYPFGKAPSQRLKYEQYYQYFEEAGYEVHTSSFIDDDFWKIVYSPGFLLLKLLYTLKGYGRRIVDLLNIRKYDVIYVHLWVTPVGPPIFEWLYSRFAKSLMYDIDDLIYLKPKSKSNPLINLFKSSNKSFFLMKKADHVITCTPYLDSFVRKINTHTTDISSTINTDTYVPKVDYSPNGKLVLGWSGSHSTSKYLYLLQDVLLRVRQQHDFKLLVIGDPIFKIEGLDVEAIAWKEENEVRDLSRIDIGLYPLPNEEWVLGKSGLKALQYMALGIPTIATAIGANFRVIEDNVSGFLVNSDEEWLARISQLIQDVSLRQRIGQEATKRVEASFSLKANAGLYLAAINQAIVHSLQK